MPRDDFLSPDNFSDSSSTSPIPSINFKGESKQSDLVSNSVDIKRQLSQSLGGGVSHGGISKPSSRRGSLVPIRSNDSNSDGGEQDDGDDDGHDRKRRDNINDKIQELLTLVPEDLFKDTGVSKDPDDELMRNSGTKDGKPNKGQILTKSVEYIQYLQNQIDENNRKEVELLLKLKSLGVSTSGSSGRDGSIGHTSAEVALGKIGVGPLSTDYFKKVLVASANANKSQRRGS
ncbi:retrograde regulation protein 1 [Yamadazyma tenuis]|uniref:retrograde regulation protein 1 n=1 Tax=Candida tenuis TaxID=2315449 RepID=UPI0027A1C082|nr:retrograde regulation protein 1 [Yamadazyma tenuis]